YTLSLHDALPICLLGSRHARVRLGGAAHQTNAIHRTGRAGSGHRHRGDGGDVGAMAGGEETAGGRTRTRGRGTLATIRAHFLSSAKCGSSDTFRGAAFRATLNVTGTSAERTHCVIVRPLATTISTGTVAVKSLSTPDCVTVPRSRRFGAVPFTVQL